MASVLLLTEIQRQEALRNSKHILSSSRVSKIIHTLVAVIQGALEGDRGRMHQAISSLPFGHSVVHFPWLCNGFTAPPVHTPHLSLHKVISTQQYSKVGVIFMLQMKRL